jgi:hypothetical protein
MASAKTGARREAKFRRFMAKRGVILSRPPRSFRFHFTVYTPDFYDPLSDTYYEVLGSRQRAHALMPTMDLMSVVYPEIRLVAVTPDGEAVELHGQKRWARLEALGFGRRLHERMACEGLRWSDVGKKLGMSPSTIHQAISHGKATPKTIAKLEAFADAS